MLDKIIIVDFEDSFTYNIANILYPYIENISVIGHLDFFGKTCHDVLLSKKKHAVILGPGPGHPRDYQHYFDRIKLLQDKENIFCMGICLGHQILGMINHYEIDYSKVQMHGQKVEVIFNENKYWVQRYNSLAVFQKGDEIDIINYTNGISYQFHPESIGTNNNLVFFQELLAFLK